MQEYEKIEITGEEVVPTARRMKEAGVALTMIHGFLDKDGRPVISYDYARGAKVESYTVTGESVLPTVSGIYSEAAAWPEREINELMPVEFTGLDTSRRLFLPEDQLDERGQILVEKKPD